MDRIEAMNPKLNAVVTLAAKAVMPGENLGPLHGAPFTVKDSIDNAGLLKQRGSPIFKGRVPEVDATVVARMKQAGAPEYARGRRNSAP